MSTKLHRHLLEQLSFALVEVFAKNQHAEIVLDRIFSSQRKWGARDRRFFAENFYDCVRWWRKIWFLLEQEPPRLLSNAEALKAWSVYWLLKGESWSPLLGLSEVEALNIQRKISAKILDQAPIQIRESVPDWFNEWGLQERGERWESILTSLNQKSEIDLRVNLSRTTRKKIQDQLRQQDIQAEEIAGIPSGLTLSVRKNLQTNELFQQGFFEIQDRGSQQIATILPVQPNWMIIDACAGAGGKTLQLADLMKNQGQIIALDIHEWKLKELKKRALRNKFNNIETRWISGPQVISELREVADAVLLDVPCSGSGVLRRHPDTKWKLTSTEVESLLQTQADILKNYSQMVKSGGLLVYATCSVMASENQHQIDKFLQQSSIWGLVAQKQIDPDQNQGDGFFAALLQRK